jgi:alpha-galactosidase
VVSIENRKRNHRAPAIILTRVAAQQFMTKTDSYSSEFQIVSRLSPEDCVPNGDLQKKVWQQAARVRFNNDWRGERNYPEAETQAATYWTRSHLYVGFECEYTTLNLYEDEDPSQERWELWDRDVVEVFVNPNPERMTFYYEFEVAPNNQWIDLEVDLEKEPFFDAKWASQFEHATRINSIRRVWTCEMRIPFTSLGVASVEPGTEWRINFYRADGPGDDSVRRFLAWSPTFSEKPNFHVPAHFGRIHFQK